MDYHDYCLPYILQFSYNTIICGGTAIATIASIIKAKESEIAYAMAAIFLFDLFAALSYPYLADILNLTTNQFGFLAGAAINDTSSSFIYSYYYKK